MTGPSSSRMVGWATDGPKAGGDLAGHVLGSMRSAASVRHNLRETFESMRRAKGLGGPLVDHMTAIQVEGRTSPACRPLLRSRRKRAV